MLLTHPGYFRQRIIHSFLEANLCQHILRSRKHCHSHQGHNIDAFCTEAITTSLGVKYEQLQTSLAMLDGRIASPGKSNTTCLPGGQCSL